MSMKRVDKVHKLLAVYLCV